MPGESVQCIEVHSCENLCSTKDLSSEEANLGRVDPDLLKGWPFLVDLSDFKVFEIFLAVSMHGLRTVA